MITRRNGVVPIIDSSSVIAASAQVVGNVTIGRRCYVDYNVVIESSGAPIVIGDETVLLANSVVRSTGGADRPPFPVRIGDRSVIAPMCALAGCTVGSHCYVATAVMIFQGALIGDNCRLAAGSIVHVKSVLPPNTHVGLRHIVVPTDDGFLATADIQQAREALARADFFDTVFDEPAQHDRLHSVVMDHLLREVSGWTDSPEPPRDHQR